MSSHRPAQENSYMWVDTVKRSRLNLQHVHHKNARW